MPDHVFKRIADEVGKHGALIRITGTGEPLIHKRLVELVEYAASKGARIGLITNGSLLNRDKIRRLLSSNMDLIEVSVDAMDSGTYSKIRPGLDYDTMEANVESLVSERDQLGVDTSIAVSIIDQPDKLKNAEQAVAYWENKVDKVIFRKFITWNVKPLMDLQQNENFSEPFLDPHERVPCPWPFDRVHVSSDGKILFCADDLKREHIIGDVMESSIHDLWNGPKFESYRQLHLDGDYNGINICANCADWPYKSWNYNYFHVLNGVKKQECQQV